MADIRMLHPVLYYSFILRTGAAGAARQQSRREMKSHPTASLHRSQTAFKGCLRTIMILHWSSLLPGNIQSRLASAWLMSRRHRAQWGVGGDLQYMLPDLGGNMRVIAGLTTASLLVQSLSNDVGERIQQQGGGEGRRQGREQDSKTWPLLLKHLNNYPS